MSYVLSALAAALPPAAGWSVHGLFMRRRFEEARRDPLTGLLTRAPFEERARKSLAQGQWRAVFLVDLDGFKAINDQLGHAAGDAVIRAVGQWLGEWAGTHGGFAGRLGGDEFVALTSVVGPSQSNLDNVHAQTMDLLHRLERPVVFDGRSIDVRASVGISRYWRGPADLPELLRMADEHMYRAKREGGGASIAPPRRMGSPMATVHGRRAGRRGTAVGGEAS
ncbi:GGDEF domain-containing protein [Streptomyces sp. NPDC089919]|uniref:GGDEF domain-containing protein n=1 Tax=Streptomyces sp. NPDC089919 TaxID=3155188 RepID=UPI00343FF3DE